MGGIYLRHAVFSEPEVIRTAAALGISVAHAVGCFAQLWSWADQHVRDLPTGETGIPAAYFDQMVAVPDFVATAARTAPHWIVLDGEVVQFLNLEKHNGPSAKMRRDDAARKRAVRAQAATVPSPKAMKTADGPIIYPDWLPMDTWIKFVAYRKEMRKPMGQLAKEASLRRLGELREKGHDPKEMLELAMAQGWQGVFAQKDNGKKPEPARYVPPDLPKWMQEAKKVKA